MDARSEPSIFCGNTEGKSRTGGKAKSDVMPVYHETDSKTKRGSVVCGSPRAACENTRRRVELS